MDKNGFGSRATGQLVHTIGGRKAFVPAPLPPGKLDPAKVLPALTHATQAVGELKGIGRTVANPLLLIRPLQRREAVSSSSMEGTYTTLSDLSFSRRAPKKLQRAAIRAKSPIMFALWRARSADWPRCRSRHD
ncbi:Fic/DOC family N-terminal domain-containing protein [Sphingomonas sp.]|jgi:hypothetical protein|uniref:Fic/DOC family N-terminal domain-containing protein n=1 Tax=Sphingomonas sp. TaxID=28214 RepID=UPI002EDB8E65